MQIEKEQMNEHTRKKNCNKQQIYRFVLELTVK